MTLHRIGSLGRPVYAHVLGDMTQASAPIRLRYYPDSEEEHEMGTPYQTADARHERKIAVRLARDYDRNYHA